MEDNLTLEGEDCHDDNDHFAGYVVDDSDLEYSDCSSSDDELSQLTLSHQKTKPLVSLPSHLVQNKPHPSLSEESEDEFEKEMDKEAELLVTKLFNPLQALPPVVETMKDSFSSRGLEEIDPSLETANTRGEGEGERGKGGESKKKGSGEDLFYDQIYFDSSSGEEDVLEDKTKTLLQKEKERSKKKKDKTKVRKLTNDELLYDPNLDEEDERWVQRQRRAYHNIKEAKDKKDEKKEGNGKGEGKGEGATACPMSDAVLNCPACLSTLCLDCQRHDVYQNQFRAMFVLNCTIVRNELLHYKPAEKRKRQREDPPSTSSEQYHPVKCTICNTEVAVLDREQVFHFFNVLASPS